MKGGVAAFLAAAVARAEAGVRHGTISLLITGDEEGSAVNGTVKVVEWAKQKGIRFDAAIVGAATSVRKSADGRAPSS